MTDTPPYFSFRRNTTTSDRIGAHLYFSSSQHRIPTPIKNLLNCSHHALELTNIVHVCRSLLLSTIPILIAALIALVLSSIVSMGSVVNAIISTIGVVVFTSIFVMAFGIIPNILCSEIFPTRVRGLCITICALTYWIGNITITYTTPLLLTSIGLSGVFSIYVIGCTISYIFVYFKVPETKGMPLEVICELFAMGATAKQQAVEAVDNWLECLGISDYSLNLILLDYELPNFIMVDLLK